ncbi:tyrosine-type recombinase/integrase [Rhodococcus sp. UNC363MFTsu5.1]|uniref:tyrosine-type recombinase/integrase n=1 Tax=Rhodococcus sp. UNC363MFTsu5.1 TaxID=1449069 RepID=UPI000488B1B8|nr:site-specific integrase [Rhodococcus sp. UNC363MFTsu5.1]
MARVRDLWMTPNPNGKGKIRTARYGTGKRWLAVWNEAGREVSRTFTTRDAAEAAIAKVRTDQDSGTYIAKANRDITLREVWPIWWATKAGKSKSTRAGYEAAWKHIDAKWGGTACAQITRSGVAAWLPILTTTRGCKEGESKPVGEATQRKVGIVLGALLQTAVDERIIPASPMRKGDIPRQKVSERRYLSVAELDRLRDAAPGRHERLVVDVLTRTGVRPGESWGFQVGDLAALRGRLRVMRDIDQSGVVDETKTRRHRDVPVGGDLLLDLENATEGRARGEWLLTTASGEQWTAARWRNVWSTMVEKAGLGELDTYELRHTAASLAIHSGANVKTVQRMLGHASAAMTLDIYGHLWDDELDALPAAMDAHMKAERTRFTERRRKAEAEQGRNTG